jgi:putative (di)nucleoside polyphosphate hydrolase
MSPAYRPNVGAIILNPLNQVFLGERLDSPGSWQIPQGGIDYKKNESPVTALWREISEELGLERPQDHMQIVAEHPLWLQYDFPEWVREKGGRLGKYLGQRQKYFLLRFHGKEELITLGKNGKREFSSFKWENIDLIAEKTIDFKKPVAKKAVAWAKKYL